VEILFYKLILFDIKKNWLNKKGFRNRRPDSSGTCWCTMHMVIGSMRPPLQQHPAPPTTLSLITHTTSSNPQHNTIKRRLWFWFCFRVADLFGPPSWYDTDTNPVVGLWESMYIYTSQFACVSVVRELLCSFGKIREEKWISFHWNGPYKLQNFSAGSTKSSRYHWHALFINLWMCYFFLSVFPFSLINHIASSIFFIKYFLPKLRLSHFIY